MEFTGRETRMFGEVKVINYPYTIENGEKLYSLGSGVVVESVIEEIPERLRPAITLDFEKIPQYYFDEHKRKVREMIGKTRTPEEVEEMERKLVEIFFGENSEENAPAR